MMNIVLVGGTLLDRPKRRQLADGRSILVGTVITAHPDGSRESVPFTWFEAPDRADRLEADDQILAVGRIDRRFFRSGGRTESLTDLVVTDLHPARHRRRVEKAMRTTLAPVQEVLSR